jgi:hypothetical protein
MRPETELISVTLEIMAFFLVTLDLYGEERLARSTKFWSSRMESISTRIQRRVWEPFVSAYERISRSRYGSLFGSVDDKSGEPPTELLFTVVTVFVIVPIFSFIFMALFTAISNTDFYPTGFFRYVLEALTIIGLCIAGLVVVLYTFMALLLFLKGVMHGGLWLLRQMKFEGVLLYTGAMLFVVAKGMIWWNSAKDTVWWEFFYKLIRNGS